MNFRLYLSSTCWYLSVLLLVYLAVPVQAQVKSQAPEDNSGGSGGSFEFKNPLAKQGFQSGPPVFPRTLPMEGAIDPSHYILGPNDLLTVSIGGPSPMQHVLAVSADGNLVLPGSGTLAAANRSLQKVTRQAEKLLKQQYQNVPVTVSLSQPRTFYVHVTGAVPGPGRYQAQPVARVSSVLKQALTQKGSDKRTLNGRYQPSLRQVVLKHKDGSSETLDLLNYYATGDKRQNPYLQDGDVVQVTSFNPNHESVQVTGEVPYPGTYEYRTGDTVLDVLELAAGPRGLDQLPSIRLSRHTSNGSPTSKILNIADLQAGRQAPPSLQPGDILHIASFNANAGRAAVTGFVNYPGTYPIEEGQTTLQELVEMAGGFRAEAHVPGAILARRHSQTPQAQPSTNNLNFVGRTFLQKSLKENQKLSINVAHALQTKTDTIRIYNGDRLTVPRDERSVLVIGEVNQAGYVPYHRGMSVNDYVQQAGGKGTLSTRTYVVKAASSEWIAAPQIEKVESGDVIFVNRQPIADSPEIQQLALMEKNAERDARIRTIQTILTGIGTVTGIVTTFVALFRR